MAGQADWRGSRFQGVARRVRAGRHGESAYSLLERLWTRPTCDLNGFLSGYTGESARTVLPATAMAKVSFRLVPGQSSLPRPPDRLVTFTETVVPLPCDSSSPRVA